MVDTTADLDSMRVKPIEERTLEVGEVGHAGRLRAACDADMTAVGAGGEERLVREARRRPYSPTAALSPSGIASGTGTGSVASGGVTENSRRAEARYISTSSA